MLEQLIFAQDDPVSEVTDSATSMWRGFLEALPRIGIALLVLAVGWLVGRLLRRILKRMLVRGQTESFATVMSKIASWVVIGIAALLGITVAAPSIAPVDLLAGLGFFSVAIGFAFQDILENLLAGVLLLFREPFHAGDQVEVNGHLGTVEGITIRETRLRTFDGQRVLVPNADVYKNAIRVQTAFEERRLAFVVGVAYEADLTEARAAIEGALQDTEGVQADPPPEAFITELGAATINYQARFWCHSSQHDAMTVQDRAIEAVTVALDAAGIEMPSDIVALQATSSFAAAIQGGRVTPGGGVDEPPTLEHQDAAGTTA
jgi:small conductance mechanosensitive channel